MKTKYNSALAAADAGSGGQTQNNSIRRQWFALALVGFLFTSIFALVSPVEAQCPQGWDISGNWGLKQSNQAAPNSLSIDRSIPTYRGDQIHKQTVSGTASYPGMTGTVSGNVVGDKVHLEISWKNNLTGIYDGMISVQGRINGTAYEKSSGRGVPITFYSDRVMKCYPAPPSPTPDPIQVGRFVTVKRMPPINSLSFGIKLPRPTILDDVVVGRTYQVKAKAVDRVTIKTPEGKKKEHELPRDCVELAADQTPPRPPKPVVTPPPPAVTPPPAVPAPPQAPSKTGPTITANPRVVVIPAGQSTGTTTLTWDAGKDHPYAEVWVKVDDGDESQIVEQGKGSRQANVEPGKTYLYILTDSGQRLSTVTVTTK